MTRTYYIALTLPGKEEGWPEAERQICYTIYTDVPRYRFDWCRIRIDGKWLAVDKDLQVYAEAMPDQWQKIAISKLLEILDSDLPPNFIK